MLDTIRKYHPDARVVDEWKVHRKDYIRFISHSTFYIAEKLVDSDLINIYKMEGRVINASE